MKILSCLIALWICQSACGAKLDIRQPVVVVKEHTGIHNARPVKGNKDLMVFISFYVKEGEFAADPKLLEALVAKAKGGFHEEDPLPSPTVFQLVILNPDKNGMTFFFSDDGKISYQGVKEFDEGWYDDDDSVFPAGSFEDRHLAAQMIESWKATLVKPVANGIEVKREVFGIKERDLFANCFYLEYPLTYQVDRKGGIVPVSMLPRAQEGEIKEGDLHTLILRDPSGELEVRASSYGFIGDTGVKERGIKSPREVVLMDYVQNSATVTITEKDQMEMIRMDHGKVITVLFVKKNPEWNTNCVQSLSFRLKDEGQYENFEKEIERMINDFVPAFAIK